MSASLVAAAVIAIAALVPLNARASCNVIPHTTTDFRAALGATNRPFAGPGDFVTVAVRTNSCDFESPGFVDLPGGTDLADDYAVTLLFEPPNGVANAHVLATDCASLAAELAACGAAPELAGGSVTCTDQQAGTELVVTSSAVDYRARFRFPDTPYAGPVTIAISGTDSALPCSLGDRAVRCADSIALPGLAACVDELFVVDGTCRTTTDFVDPTYGSFTALPPANDYQAMCTTSGTACDHKAPGNVYFTVDADGNALAPIDWSGVQAELDGQPIARLTKTGTSIEAVEGGGTKIFLPNGDFLGSYSPEGVRLPPIFAPLADPDPLDPNLNLFGTVDAARGVIRVARRSPTFQECRSDIDEQPEGAKGIPCTGDGDCSAGYHCGDAYCRDGNMLANPLTECTNDAACSAFTECGPQLFDFRSRFSNGGTGPIVISNAFYTAAIDKLVALDGLVDTSDFFAFAVNESVDVIDLNSDGDTSDFITAIHDGTTGALEPSGYNMTEGRPVVRIRQNPFRYAALVGEDDVVAFLEPEPGQADVGDVSGDDDVADTILRVYREDPMSPGDVEEITTGDIAADAAPNVAGRSLSLSDGLVFFRQAEDAAAPHVTEYASVTDMGDQISSPTVLLGSDDSGDSVLFLGELDDVIDGKISSDLHAFARNVSAGPATTEWLSFGSVGGPAQEPDDLTRIAVISGDGRYVVFESPATDIVAGAAGHQTYLHDRMSGTTTELALSDSGAVPDDLTFLQPIGLSYDGSLVLFTSSATNLLPGGQMNPVCSFAHPIGDCIHVFLHDRDAGTTELVDVSSGDVGSNGYSLAAAMSPDGRFVAFASNGRNLLDGPAPPVPSQGQFYLRDRVLGTTELISVATNGGFSNQIFSAGDIIGWVSLSDDGRFVAFPSSASNLVAGDTNGVTDVFVRDRVLGVTERVSVASDGSEGTAGTNLNQSYWAIDLSSDGRFVLFPSDQNDLVDDDGNSEPDTFLRDRLTGITQRVSVASDGTQGPLNPFCVNQDQSQLDSAARVASFYSCFELTSTDTQTTSADLFVRRPDPADTDNDFNNDSDHRDTVLRVLDARDPSPMPMPVDLGPATVADVAGGNAVFLQPEWETGASGTDLNSDADAEDEVVFLYRNRNAPAENLGKAASSVAISADYLAVISEDAGEEGRLAVHETPAPGSWDVLTDIADSIDVNGAFVAFTSPETGGDLNGDGDTADRVIGLYEFDTDGANSKPILNGGQRVPALDFVLGAEILAFSTREGDLCGTPVDAGNCAAPPGCMSCDLNGDGDCCDDVVQTFDLVNDTLANSGKAMLPCELSACDPRTPYRVTADTVRFLTYEPDQGAQDLNGDGDANDLLVHLLNVRSGTVSVVGEISLPPGASFDDPDVVVSNPVAAPQLDEEEGEGTVDVFQSSGLCMEPPGATACTDDGDCASGELCDTVAGFCAQAHGTCTTSADCPEVATCSDDRLIVVASADTDGDQIPDPLDNCPTTSNVQQADLDSDGVGDLCDIRTCGNAQQEDAEECDGPDPGPPEACDVGCCLVAGVCDVDTDGTVEQGDVAAVLAAEGTPAVGLCDRRDPDRDGTISTADTHLCEATCPYPTCCGNGLFSGSETCDDGGVMSGDGCTATCTIEAGWSCSGEPSMCGEICGDSMIVGAEECDDGGTDPGDGCSAICTIEDAIPVYGFTRGGIVSVTVDGVEISIVTGTDWTAAELADALAAAIEADPTLSAQGVTATRVGESLVTDGAISAFSSTDPGIGLGLGALPPPSPALPIGSIVAWHRDLTGTPALPAGWQEADGTVVTDPESPLYMGDPLPDLNGEARFLRGGATAGVPQAQAFQGHYHAVSHDLWEIVPSSTTYSATDFVDDFTASISVGNPIDSPGNGTAQWGNETRPINASVVWIVKVKPAGVPVGSIVAWHQDLPGTPVLPDGWVPLGGQTSTDSDGAYEDETIPDWNGERRFLRGGASSGVTQPHQFQGHHHAFTHTGERITGGPGWGHSPGQPQFADVAVASIAVLDPTTDATYGDVRTGNETRPINMSVVWLLKTKASAGEPPLGSIVAWHPQLAGVPALPLGLQPANGLGVYDPKSPMAGQIVPDLNGETRFLRGDTASGALEDDRFQSHRHDVSSDANRLVGGTPLTSDPFNRQVVDVPGSFAVFQATDGSNGAIDVDDETRPVNLSVVWVVSVSQGDVPIPVGPPWLRWAIAIALVCAGSVWLARSRGRNRAGS